MTLNHDISLAHIFRDLSGPKGKLLVGCSTLSKIMQYHNYERYQICIIHFDTFCQIYRIRETADNTSVEFNHIYHNGSFKQVRHLATEKGLPRINRWKGVTCVYLRCNSFRQTWNCSLQCSKGFGSQSEFISVFFVISMASCDHLFHWYQRTK